MTEEFIEVEKQWLELLMAVDFPGKEVIERQLAEAYVTERVIDSYYARVFMKTTCQDPYPYRLFSPVGMDAIQKDGVPISFNLFLNTEGVIDYLALNNIAGEDIDDYYNINFDDVRYDVTYSRHDGTVRLRDS